VARKRIAKAPDDEPRDLVAEAEPTVVADVEQTMYLVDDAELDRIIEQTARAALGCSAEDAFERLAKGELRGTAVADDLYMLQSLRNAA
jgi:hypothetical protein